MIIDDLIQLGINASKGKKIQDVRAGLGYTCVMFEDNSCGLAYTFRNELGEGCGTLDAAGTLIGRDAGDIMMWAKESNRLRAAIGLAAVNAAINDSKKSWNTGNVLTAFTLNESDTFGMVGEFHPILQKVKTMTKNIYVFEQNVPEDSELYPSDTIPLHLPKCDVVVITATSLINHTFDEVISCCKNAREVCIVGPSTPLCPEVFEKYNVTLLAGSVVKDPKLALQIISQGGGTMAMKPAINQVLVKV
jgi:uncharacterized protein (DUF4213/DUF364 family)